MGRSLSVRIPLVGVLTMLCLTYASPSSTASGMAAGHALSDVRAIMNVAPNSSSGTASSNLPCRAFYCDFRSTGYTHMCFESQGDVDNWGVNVNCRNVDESFANDDGAFIVRLYYHPQSIQNGGAWVCFPIDVGISNLSGYWFNNGSGKDGYGLPVENDVASSLLGTGTCSNPITNEKP